MHSLFAKLLAFALALIFTGSALYAHQNPAQGSQGVLLGLGDTAKSLVESDRESLPPPPAELQSLPVNPDPNRVSLEQNDGHVTLVARNASLEEVLSVLGEAFHLNLVLNSPGANVTLTLNEVPLEVAIDSILEATGHTRTTRSGIIFISSLANTTTGPSAQGREIRVFQLDYAAAPDVDLAIKQLLSPAGKSWVIESSPADNRRTREVVVVEDVPQYMARIEDYIAQLDMPPRQVLIEAHILEIELANDKRHGVDFEQLMSISGANINLQTTGFANAAAPQAFFLTLESGSLDSVVEVLQSTTDAKTLASPRVLALNGQLARIQIGEQLGFRVTTTTQTATLESVEFLDVGVVLSVTPRITKDGRVLMHIEPEVSSGAVNPETGLPEESTTEVQTDVMLHNGQGIVIGGLIQEGDSIISSKIPWLGDLKYVGALFQRRRAVKTRSEIVVCLRPFVLPLTDCAAERNQFDVMRTDDRLFHGPLYRNPRVYEPRLPDSCINPEYLVKPRCDGTLKRLPPVEIIEQ